MPLLIALLILAILYPFILIPILIYLAISFVFFLPLFLFFGSLFFVLSAPLQLLEIFFKKTVRKNHSLEHATANVLEEHLGPLNISGYAKEDGFYLMGDLPAYQLVLEAAQIGLERMKRGERDLAIHPRCGTSIVAANLLFSLVFLGTLFLTGYLSLINIVGAIVVAHLLGRPFGTVLQRYVTTTPDVSDMEILGIVAERHGFGLFGFFPGYSEKVFIKTRRIKVRRGAGSLYP